MKKQNKTYFARRLLLLATTAILPLTFAQTAQAQDAVPYSFGEMMAENGGPLTLPLGISATTTTVTLGAGSPGSGHGQTNPSSMGGAFPAGSTGWDEANRTIGSPVDMTRIHTDSGDSETQFYEPKINLFDATKGRF